MSVKKISEVWDYAFDLKGEALLVMLALADFANDDGVCWPKMATIAQKARLTETGASQIVRRLEEGNYLKVLRGHGRGNSSRYIVCPRGDADKMAANFEDKRQAKNPNEKTPFQKSLLEKPLSSQDKTPTGKPLFSTPAYKEEPSVLKPSIEPSCGGGGVLVQEEPPPRTTKTFSQFPKTEKAMFEVTGAFGDGRDRQEIGLNVTWLSENVGTEDEAVATALRAAFAHWDKTTPPRLSQIRSEYRRLELIARRNSQPEVSNGSHSRNSLAGLDEEIRRREARRAARANGAG